MKKYSLLCLAFLQSIALLAQELINFENLSLPAESYWNGSDLSSNGYTESGTFFPTLYDTAFGGYWAGGFALSNQTDSLTPGWGNQYASRAGSGALGSSTYAVAYGNGFFYMPGNAALAFDTVYLTNNSFAYYSMLNGDAFSKKFGGLDGTDPDYFRVNFRGFMEGMPVGSPVTVYLADYRSDNPAEDYILKDWTLVDFSSWGYCDSVVYEFESTDVGEFGINTPLYFCLDYLVGESWVIGMADQAKDIVQVYPNPSQGSFRISGLDGPLQVRVWDVQGRCVVSQTAMQDINLAGIAPGMVMLQLTDERGNSHYLRHLIVP